MQQSKKRPPADAEGAKVLLRELTALGGNLPALVDMFGPDSVADLLCLVQAVLEGYVIQLSPTDSAVFDVLARVPSGDRWRAYTMAVRSSCMRDLEVITYRKTTVSGEWIKGGVEVAAYVASRRWNGWAKPYFTLEQGRDLLAVMPELSYDSSTDRFVAVLDANDPSESRYEYGLEVIEVDGQSLKVYPIGAGDWCWST